VKLRFCPVASSCSMSWIFFRKSSVCEDSLIFLSFLLNCKKSYSARKLVTSSTLNSCSRVLSAISFSPCHSPFLSSSSISSMASKACFSLHSGVGFMFEKAINGL